ncbi:N-acetylmuramoyl-L-alanine amidase [Stenotrophomonas maltophilia]|uniref:N-acetylmuramoyl-L-alanine amidase AmiC n=1 Tax=Stenotrophomonas maltophilia TaxID=40324 RepID=A0AAX1IDK0_STEMA|nr:MULTISPECIES: N-acetylmuramoyl-L-alanine amidase [Stenotrophomonas maltophilia group]MCF3497643.1 AMIN domain-containing protein [Stenotrophomonas maltophilia]MDQ4682242.1 N-acetylmuramoyl-L-alanine amidase [Stenotrophomonas maltophilia group sp. RNC7]QGL81190.1 N-acetylmuramoyl-L-alanine amidase [Stenotrophomonas maltophilia]QNG77953.1 N-acetylmuramoyl-L-alanine amidase [Stenotrophomonas maltophilia]UGB20457.1 N-acetylmuramoyl-L-alanine amidase [Stenotrophomonas maltophilia]
MRPGNRLIAICAAVGLGLASVSAWAGEVRQVLLNTGATGTRAEISLVGSGGYKTLSLAGPNRLVVDFPDSSAVRNLKMPAAQGVVTAVRTGQPVPGTFRVVFDLAESVAPFRPQMQREGNESKLVIEWPGDGPAMATSRPATPPAVQPQAAAVGGSVAPTPAENAQSRTDAARATALLTAQVQQQASASAAAPATPTPAPTSAPAQVAAAGVAASSTPSSSPAAILAGQRTAAVVTTPPATAPTPAPTPAEPPRPAMPSDASRIRMQPGMRHLVVAIDPGHGGQDPGAIGPTGKREKDVTLAVARELARQVNATPGLKAYLTRDSDVFIPLPMRAQKARANKADIFISIHADAAENRSATGSSVYVLSTKGASSQRARWLADKENAADLVGGVRLQQTEGTLANVLLDLAQSGYMKASEDAAGHVLGGLKRIGNNHKPNIERANFAVLRTSDMPAMLVETAFISNPDEERRLTDPAYQRKVAGAVLDGVHTFFSRQPPPGTLYAARAQAEIDAAATMAGGSK